MVDCEIDNDLVDCEMRYDEMADYEMMVDCVMMRE